MHERENTLPGKPGRNRQSDSAAMQRGQPSIARGRPVLARVVGLDDHAVHFFRRLLAGRRGDAANHRIDCSRIIRVEAKFGGAVVVVLKINFPPGLAAVGGFVNAARVAGRDVSHCGDINRVGVLGIHQDRRDVGRVGDPDVGPGRAGIRGFPDAIARRLLAGGDVNRVGIGGRNHQIADGSDMRVVKNWNPGDAARGGFPDAAARRAHVISFGIARDPGNRGDAATTKWTDQPPGETLHLIGSDLLRRRNGDCGSRKAHEGKNFPSEHAKTSGIDCQFNFS